jgi:hypothetical protein
MILLPYYVNMRRCLDETQLSHDSPAVLCERETVFRWCYLEETQLSHDSPAVLRERETVFRWCSLDETQFP